MKELKRGANIRLLFDGKLLFMFESKVRGACNKFILSIYSIHQLILNIAVLKLHMAAL